MRPAAKPKFVVMEEPPVATARNVPLNVIILLRASEEKEAVAAAIDGITDGNPRQTSEIG